MFLLEAPKTLKKTQKCASEILVYGFILARVNQKPKSQVERRGFLNRGPAGARAEFP
jgi:hypothetical protein